MQAHEWKYFPMGKAVWRPINPDRNRTRRQQMVSKALEAPTSKLRASVERARNGDDSGVEPALIYNEMVAKYGDPNAPVQVGKKYPNMSRSEAAKAKAQERVRTGRLAAAVWNSLNPDGTVDPDKMVPMATFNTDELPTIESRTKPVPEVIEEVLQEA